MRVGGSLGMLANTENGMVDPADGGNKLVLNVQDRKGLPAISEALPSWQRSSAHPWPRSPGATLLVGPRDKTNLSTQTTARVTNVMDKYLGTAIGQRPAPPLHCTEDQTV
jgi:hypothetical protein